MSLLIWLASCSGRSSGTEKPGVAQFSELGGAPDCQQESLLQLATQDSLELANEGPESSTAQQRRPLKSPESANTTEGPSTGAIDDPDELQQTVVRQEPGVIAPLSNRVVTVPAPSADLRSAPPVYFSVFLDNIKQINGETGLWVPDVVVTSRYSTIDFPAEGPQPKVHANGGGVEMEETRKVNSSDETIITERFTVPGVHFDDNFDLFPFDEQLFNLVFSISGLTGAEARLVQDPNVTSGIREEERQASGRTFKTSEFNVEGWELQIETGKEGALPYAKSYATLKVHGKRRLPYYVLTCMIIPSMMVVFAMGAFYLPIAPITPRVMISFVAFLSTIVHLKQMMSQVPRGVWSWALSEMIFFSSLLSVAILMNICSAWMAKTNILLADNHDTVLRKVLPVEFLFGMALLIIFKARHILIFVGVLLPVMSIYHVLFAGLSCYHAQNVKADVEKEPDFLLNALSFGNLRRTMSNRLVAMGGKDGLSSSAQFIATTHDTAADSAAAADTAADTH